MSVTQAGRGGAGGHRGSVSGYEAVHVSREFRTLRRYFGSFAVPVTVVFLIWYFLYVAVAAFAPGFMKIHVIGDVNIGLCFGLLQFVSAFGIAVAYRRWARRNLDPISARIRHRLEARREH